MAGLLNIGEMGALALHTLVELTKARAINPGVRVSVSDLAAGFKASQHTLHKVVTRLVNAGLIDSARGPAGGIRLTEDPENISVLRVIEAVEGKICANACLFAQRVCPAGAPCAFSFLTDKLETQIRGYFIQTSIKELTESIPQSQACARAGVIDWNRLVASP